jgi:hypothetical protein
MDKRYLSAYGILAVWLILIGTLTWHASQRCVVPPLWDQQSYVQKADSFWHAVNARKPFNPLNLNPSVRPPGTVLVAAPFGPETDYRRFYFRSVVLPAALFVLALLIAGFAAGIVGAEHAILTAAFCSMPLFWQFEMTDAFRVGYFWGLVDAFFASVAALSAAVFLLAAVRRSSGWFACGVFIALLLPLIKPAGFLIYVMLIGCWFVLLIVRIRSDPGGIRGGVCQFLMTLGAAGACILFLAWVSVKSEYFSKENILFGKEALRQLKSIWADVYAKDEFFGIFTNAIGLSVMAILVVLLGGYAVGKMSGRPIRCFGVTVWDFALAAAVVIFGVLACYQATHFKQARYFFPFVLVAAVFALPLLTVLLRRSGFLVKSAICLPPAGLLFFLLVPGHEVAAHQLCGYSLFSGQYRELPGIIQRLVSPGQTSHFRAPVIYTTSDSSGVAAFEACLLDQFKRLPVSKGNCTVPTVLRPINWQSEAAIRLSAVAGADLVVFTALPEGSKADFSATFAGELQALVWWLSQNPPPDGSELVYSNGRTRCVRITDGDAFEESARKFVASREWREDFLRVNEHAHFLASEVPKDPPSIATPKRPMDFGGVVRVHRLDCAATAGTLKVTAYTELLAGTPAGELSIFIHQLAADGTIISNNMLSIPQFTSKTHPIEHLTAEIKLDPKTEKIGVGICEAGGVALVTDERAQEWDQRRVVFPVGKKISTYSR